MIKRYFGFAVLLLAVFCAGYGAEGDARAQETINIFPANADDAAVTKVRNGPDGSATATEDNLSCGLTGAGKSALACTVQGLLEMAGPGDTVIFNPAESGENRNVYDDVGEVLITTDGDDSSTDNSVETITIRGMGSGDDMITFTGKVMFNVKTSNILIRGFKFKDTEIPDSVTVRVAGSSGTPAAVKYGFPGITIRDYLVAEGAGSPAWTSSDVFSPRNINNKGGLAGSQSVNVFSYMNDPLVTVATDNKAIAKMVDGTEVGVDGSSNKQIFGSFSSAVSVASALNAMGTIWVDSVVASCPSGGISVTNVQIRNNVFDNTYLTGVKAGDHSAQGGGGTGTGPGEDSRRNYLEGGNTSIRGRVCGVQLEVVGNEFTNVGGNGPFLKNSRGVDFTDAGGNKIAGLGNREAAVNLFNVGSTGMGDDVVSSKITDNTIVGGTYDAIVVAGTRKDAKVEISYNDIKDSVLNGINIVARTDDTSAARAAATADITVEGNRIWGSSSNRFLNKPFQPRGLSSSGSGRNCRSNNCVRNSFFLPGAGWNFIDQVTESCIGSVDENTQARVIRAISPEVWKSAVPTFPFPDSGAPKSILSDNLNPSTKNEANRFRAIYNTSVNTDSIARHDLIRYRADECFNLGRIRVDGQRGVTIKNNDLGYVEDESDASVSLPNSPKNGVVVMRARTTGGVPLKAFTGNNINFYKNYAVLNTGASFSAAKNYLGPAARVQGVSGADLGGDPIAGDDRQIGPRAQNQMPPDEEDPELVRSGDGAPAVNESGTTLTLTFNDMLDATSTPAVGAFEVQAGPTALLPVNSVRISGSTVVLTLGAAARAGETITVTYTKPASNPIMDDAGNELDSFSRAAVTNNSTATDPGTPEPGTPSEPVSRASSSDDGGCSLASAGSGVDLGALGMLLGAVSFAFGLGRKVKAE